LNKLKKEDNYAAKAYANATIRLCLLFNRCKSRDHRTAELLELLIANNVRVYFSRQYQLECKHIGKLNDGGLTISCFVDTGS